MSEKLLTERTKTFGIGRLREDHTCSVFVMCRGKAHNRSGSAVNPPGNSIDEVILQSIARQSDSGGEPQLFRQPHAISAHCLFAQAELSGYLLNRPGAG